MFWKKILSFFLLSLLFACVPGEQYQYDIKPSKEVKEAVQFEIAGNYRQALETYTAALKQYREKKKDMGVLLCLERMGWLNREMGNYSLALEEFREAYPLGVALNGDAAEIDADFGDVYQFSGDNERAVEYYQKALVTLKDFVFPLSYGGPPSSVELAELTRKSKAVIHSRVNLGMLFMFSGENEKALEEVIKAEELLKRIDTVAKDPVYGMFFAPDRDFYEGLGFAFTIMGTSLAALGRYEEAWPAFDRGIVAFQQGQKEFGLIVNRALRYREEFRAGYLVNDEKIAEFDELLKNADDFGAVEVVWRMAYEIGRELKKEKKWESAYRYLVMAVDSLEETRSRLREDSLKQLFASRSQDVYVEFIGLLYDMGRYEEGFEYLERSKSRAFLDMLGGRAIKAKPSVDSALIRENQELAGKLDEVFRQIKFSDKETRAALRAEYQTLRKQRQAVLEEIKNQSLEYAATTTVSVVPTREVAAKLHEDEALLSYFLDRERTLVWLVKKDAVSAVSVPVGETAIEELTADFRDAITSGQSKLLIQTEKELSQSLILPVASLLKGTGKLFIVPTKSLNYLPFAALSVKKGRYFAQDYEITLLPNATSLFYLDKAVTKNSDRLFAIGNPAREKGEKSLRYAEEEIKNIGSHFPNKTLLIRSQGTESAVKQEDFSQTGFLHFAAHGTYNSRNPLQSALLLSGDEKNDGNLETFEIFGLDLRSRITVLSACESGVGTLGGGDEVQSMNRAFLYAGVGGVVATLWKVDDKSTYEFMEAFYRHLNHNSPAASLAKAQRELMKAYPSPYYWAPFYLTGGIANR